MRAEATRVAIAAVLLSAGILTGCASTTGVTMSPSHSNDDPPPPARISDEAPHEDLSDERQIEWSDVEIVDDHSVRIFFDAGTNSCYGYRTDVVESVDTVTVKLFEGMIPSSESLPGCTMEARATSMLVETVEPIENREIAQ